MSASSQALAAFRVIRGNDIRRQAPLDARERLTRITIARGQIRNFANNYRLECGAEPSRQQFHALASTPTSLARQTSTGRRAVPWYELGQVLTQCPVTNWRAYR